MKPKFLQRFDMILVGNALLAAFLNIYNIWQDTYANAYYTAAVTSMLQSWHNFFYASFDPAGFVTVDKPPVVFWIQTGFAYIFGVHGWSVVLPQALAGVGSVLLLYRLVKPNFGKTAARWSSLVMACTPIAVAVSRTNNIDSMLVFTLLLATWMLFRARANGRPGWVLAAFGMIGVAFNMKMLEAYMVVPAFYLFYLLAFQVQWKKKLALLAVATVIMVGISLSWAVVVDSIPQANRPYIGSSQTNSVLELAFGYNGMSRLTGMNPGGPGAGKGPQQPKMEQSSSGKTNPSPMPPGGNGMPGSFGRDGSGRSGARSGPGGGGPPGQGGGGMFGTGQAGPLRLFQSALSGQISWLLPFVAFGCVGLLAGLRRGRSLTVKEKEALFWLAWLLPVMVFFSVAGFFHQYYLIMLAPPIAALVGTGWTALWQYYHDQAGWPRWLLPAGLLATTAFQLYILVPYQGQIGWSWPIGIGAAGCGLFLILVLASKQPKLTAVAATAGLLVLLVGPLYWAATPLLNGDNGMMPQAGPAEHGGPGPQRQQNHQPGQSGGPNGGINDKLVDYLTKNNTGETFLFATADANTAESYIIQTGKAVMAMGGFSGSDPILTVDKLKQLVAKKEVQYFLISSGSGGRGGRDNNEVMNWIRAHSTQVPQAEWQNSASSRGWGPMGMGSDTLYKINQ